MVLQTETYDLSDEVQRLKGDIAELEEILDNADEDSDVRAEVAGIKQRLNVQLSGVKWAASEAAGADYCPAWGEDVDAVTLAGLTGGEVARTNDSLPAETGEGARRVNFVAAGSPHPDDDSVQGRPGVDVSSPAPYVDANQSEEDRIAVVSDLPDTYLRWAHARINELTTVGGNGSLDFDKFREAIETTSTETSNSTT